MGWMEGYARSFSLLPSLPLPHSRAAPSSLHCFRYACYISSMVMVFAVIPLAFFFYEADSEK